MDKFEKIEGGEIKPIAERSDEKRMHCGIAFETWLKIALCQTSSLLSSRI